MSLESRYIRLCDEITDILISIGDNSYTNHYQEEKQSVLDGKFIPEGEDLLCLTVLRNQLKKENVKKINKIEG